MGRSCSGWYVLRPLPSEPSSGSQTCFGTMKNCSSCGSTFPTGAPYWMTSVFSSLASALLTCASAAAATPVGPLAYLTVVLTVHAASSAVSGSPSDQVPPGFRWNVQSSPSDDVSHDSAQSPSISSWLSAPTLYWTSWG